MFWDKVTLILVICCFGMYAALTEAEMMQLCQGNTDNKFIADTTDESKYILCTPNSAYSLNCDAGLCFDVGKLPPCSTCLSSITDYCKRNDETWLELVPHKDCEYYSICLGMQLAPKDEKCPANQHFSEKLLKCTSPHEAECAHPSKWCQNTPNGIKYSDGSCSKYYECFNKQSILKSCLYYQYFDMDANECLQGTCANEGDMDGGVREPSCTANDEGVYMAHAKCNKFYVCANKVAFEGQCPDGYYFNGVQKTCLRDITNSCNY